MTSVLSCVVLMVIVGVVAISATSETGPLTSLMKRSHDNRGNCHTNIGIFRHGEHVTHPNSPCQRYRCVFGRLEELQRGCRDAYGSCRRPGETFRYTVNGHTYSNCQCSTSRQSIQYNCAPEYSFQK